MSTRKTLKKKTQTLAEVSSLAEMFPDWDSEELQALLSEHHNDVEVVIDLIVNGKVSRWEPSRKEKKKKPVEEEPLPAPFKKKFDKPKKPTKKETKPTTQPLHPKPQKQTVQTNQPSNQTSNQTSSNQSTSVPPASSGVPSNSWAAALASDKPKKEEKKEDKTLKEKKDKISHKDKESHKNDSNKNDTQKDISKETSSKDITKDISKDQADNTSSWASAITPKSKEIKPAEVVLPEGSNVHAVGVSFGSLSVEDENKETETKKEETSEVIAEPTAEPTAETVEPVTETESASKPVEPVAEAASEPSTEPSVEKAVEAENKTEATVPNAAPAPGVGGPYDYYQFAQQQFQQGGQTPSQYVYPGVDYSAYNSLNVASPAASHVNTAYQYNGTGAQESTQSPVVNPSNLQQQVPYPYPYYNMYYGAPMYGNQNVFQPQAQAQAQAQGGLAPTGQGAQSGQAAPGVNNGFAGAPSQYYNQQGSTRFPTYSYPPQPGFPQPQGEEKSGQSQGQGQGQPYPQSNFGQPIMPQYGGYQQYPQYGYQDSQYRGGWY